jgi:hypothetical protein
MTNHWFVSVEMPQLASRRARQTKTFPTEAEAKQYAKSARRYESVSQRDSDLVSDLAHLADLLSFRSEIQRSPCEVTIRHHTPDQGRE